MTKMLKWLRRKNKPNVIMITVDQFRADYVGNFHIFKKMQERGIYFSQMVTYAPYTFASMHAIISGIYGNRNGVDGYYKSSDFDSQNCLTLTQYLKGSGYYTQADLTSKLQLPAQGFDAIFFHDEFKDDMIARHKQQIQELLKKGKSFFLYLHYNIIHSKMVESVIKRYTDFDEHYFKNKEENVRRYEGYLKEAVVYLESIYGFLESSGILDNILLIVLTDHGCSLGERMGERIYGVFTYDYSIKAWAYFIYPAALPKNLEIDKVARTIDIVPTVLELLNISQKRSYQKIQGESLLLLLNGEENEDRVAYTETGGLGGPNPSPHEPNVKCIRTGEWKLIFNTTTGQKELYNLRRDRAEEENLIGRYPEIERALWQQMVKHW